MEQGKIFEQLIIKSSSLDETFKTMIESVHDSEGHNHHSHDINRTESTSGDSFLESEQQEDH